MCQTAASAIEKSRTDPFPAPGFTLARCHWPD